MIGKWWKRRFRPRIETTTNLIEWWVSGSANFLVVLGIISLVVGVLYWAICSIHSTGEPVWWPWEFSTGFLALIIFGLMVMFWFVWFFTDPTENRIQQTVFFKRFQRWIQTSGYQPMRFQPASIDEFLWVGWGDPYGRAGSYPALVVWKSFFWGWKVKLFFPNDRQSPWIPKVWKDAEGNPWVMVFDKRGMFRPVFCINGNRGYHQVVKDLAKKIYETKRNNSGTESHILADVLCLLGEADSVQALDARLCQDVRESVRVARLWNSYLCTKRDQEWKSLHRGTEEMTGVNSFFGDMRTKYPWL